jgi:hypothetical protein
VYSKYMERTLQIKQVAGGIDHYGDGTGVAAPYELYRFVDENGNGGCWYAKIENAERSWERRSK